MVEITAFGHRTLQSHQQNSKVFVNFVGWSNSVGSVRVATQTPVSPGWGLDALKPGR